MPKQIVKSVTGIHLPFYFKEFRPVSEPLRKIDMNLRLFDMVKVNKTELR